MTEQPAYSAFGFSDEEWGLLVGLPQAVTGVFQGLLLFFLLASDFLVRYRLRWRPLPAPAGAPAAE